MEKTVEIEVIEKVLMLYGFDAAITEQKTYIHAIEDNGWLKLIFRVTLAIMKAVGKVKTAMDYFEKAIVSFANAGDLIAVEEIKSVMEITYN